MPTLESRRTSALRREKLRRSTAETLNELACKLTAELDLQKLVQQVTDAGTLLTRAKFGAFFYTAKNEAGDSYLLYTLSGAPRAAFDKFGVPRATKLFEPTFQGKGVVRVADVTRHPKYGRHAPHHGMPKGHLPVRSYLAVPVVSRGGEVLGGLFFGHPRRAVFTREAETLARGIAALAAVAIDNARLYGKAQLEIDERRRAEKAWRESELRYRDLVEGLAAAVYATDAEGYIKLYNRAAVELWGRSPAIGKDRWCGSFRIFHGGREVPLDECLMAQVVKTGTMLPPQEVVIERPDGSRRTVLVHPRATHDSRGQCTGGINLLIDITERKQAEVALEDMRGDLAAQVKSLTSLRDMTAELADETELVPSLDAILKTAVAVHDADCGVLSLYDYGEETLVHVTSVGLDQRSLETLDWLTTRGTVGTGTIAFSTQQRVIIGNVASDTRASPFGEVARKLGYAAVHSVPIVTEGRKTVGALSVYFRKQRIPSDREIVAFDVCARAAADTMESFRDRQALRESETRFRSIADSAPVPIWINGANGCEFVNKAYEDFLGCPLKEIQGEGWLKFLHPDDAAAYIAAYDKAREARIPFVAQTRFRRADGEYRWISSTGMPRIAPDGGLVGYIGCSFDVTDMKRTENELIAMDRRKNEFLATLAHELRNPLAPISTGLEILRMAKDQPEVMESTRELMERQLHHLVRLIDDLLDISRISEGRLELRKAVVSLAGVIEGAIEVVRPALERAGHELHVSLPELPLAVEGDETRLVQVFANILGNACKYTPGCGHISIVTTAAGGEVTVCVKDSGVGIEPEMLPRIFEMFARAETTTDRSPGGLGIGLNITQRLVAMHGGVIDVRSEGRDRGTEVRVRLPVAEGAPEMVTRPVPDAQPGIMKVLVADDHLPAARSMAELCRLLGNEVRIARDGVEAVALSETFKPDVVFLDLGMPRLDGYDACRRMRALRSGRTCLIVAVTGWGQTEDKRRTEDAGFDGHLIKPVNVDAVRAVLARRSRPTPAPAPAQQRAAGMSAI